MAKETFPSRENEDANREREISPEKTKEGWKTLRKLLSVGVLAVTAFNAVNAFENDEDMAKLGLHFNRDIKVLNTRSEQSKTGNLEREVELQMGENIYKVVIDTGISARDVKEASGPSSNRDFFDHAKSVRIETDGSKGTRSIETLAITDHGLQLTEQEMDGENVLRENTHVLTPEQAGTNEDK